MPDAFTITTVDWSSHGDKLYAIRHQVFVAEQQVPEELERDEFDPICQHALALAAANMAIGTGRLLPDGHIGRVAVLPAWRSHGVGRALIHHLVGLARQLDFSEIHLNAQIQVLEFYEKLGFQAHGKIFMDAGIPHRSMTLRL